jgi:hypothetical protein
VERSAARLVSIALVVLVAACAAAPKPPSSHPSTAKVVDASARDDGAAESEDEGDESDDDGVAEAEDVAPESGPCPRNMALVAFAKEAERTFCIDKYEASLVETAQDDRAGRQRASVSSLPPRRRTRRARRERAGRLSSRLHQRSAGRGCLRGLGQATVHAPTP